MLSRVVKTLQAVPEVDRIIVLAQDEAVMDVLGPGAAEFARTLECISRGVADVAGTQKAPWPILVVSADHPLLTPAIVSAFITQSEGSDLCFGMVERSTLVCKYPNSQRTWFKLRDGRWTGANLWTLRNDRVVPALNLWAKAEKDRKQAWKVYLRFGPGLFLRALTQNIGMKEGMSIAGSRLGLNAQIADLPFPEAAIDVDNPADLAMVESDDRDSDRRL